MTNVAARPTMADVARCAAVSTATVSRVLNQSGPVAEEVCQRVAEAVAALGYEPRRPASERLQGTVALLITDIMNPFFPEVVQGVEDEADSAGQAVILVSTTDDSLRQQRAVGQLRRRNLDGIIVCGLRLEERSLIALQQWQGVPLVLINRRVMHSGIGCIAVEAEDGTRRGTQHLLAMGHERIGLLSAPLTWELARARRRGVEAALEAAGLSLRPEWCAVGLSSAEGGSQAMSAVLALPPGARPTAMLSFNDIMALGALHAMRTRGLRAPEDISIVGYDDIALAAHANPPLTTIAQPKYRMGRLAVEMLRDLHRGWAAPAGDYALLESPLVVRESTAPPRRSDQTGGLLQRAAGVCSG